ncbi:MAG TPA: large conductance mechanosensitive channel protein MscL [Vulgatibacter sp.]|nr:large conductance mechanosensitive channel protein MscL [Vulgatibacter sp.]
MLNDFKKFIRRGNVLDLAVAVVIGAAFGAVVKALVDDVIMPPLGLLVGKVDFSNLFVVLKQGSPPGPYATLAEAADAGAVTLRYGLFVNAVVAFLIISAAVFLVVRTVGKLVPAPAPEQAPAQKDCPYCATKIPAAAVRCPHCTSSLA